MSAVSFSIRRWPYVRAEGLPAGGYDIGSYLRILGLKN